MQTDNLPQRESKHWKQVGKGKQVGSATGKTDSTHTKLTSAVQDSSQGWGGVYMANTKGSTIRNLIIWTLKPQ